MKVRLFDVCVLGDSIGGLMAGLFIQKRHAKIAVIRKRNTIAATPYMCEFLNGFAFKAALKRIGFHPTEVNSIPSLDSPIQLVFEDHRIDCYGDEARFSRELHREFPKEAKQILQLFRNGAGHLEIYQHLLNSRTPLPPKGFFAKRQFLKVLDQVCDIKLLEQKKMEKELKVYNVGSEFGRAIEALQLSFTQLKSKWTCGAQLGHLLSLCRWDGYWTPEGMITVQNLLLDKIKERGGVIIETDAIKGMEVKGNNVVGFGLEKAEFDQVKANVVFIAGDPRGFILLDPENRRMKEWQKELDQLPAVLQKVYQLYRISAQGIPLGMKPQGILIPAGPPEGAAERRSHVRAIRYVVRQQVKPNGIRESVIGICAFASMEGTLPANSVFENEIREGLKQMIPFLDEHMLEPPSKLFIPSKERKGGDFWPAYIYESDKPRELGVMGFDSHTPFANVFVAGDLNFPGLGLDGEIIGGMHVGYYGSELLGKDSLLAD